MKQRVFHINAEVRPVTDLTLDSANVAGAQVRCFVPADSSGDAITALSDRLEADGLTLSEVEWCVDFDENEWTNPGDNSEVELADRARNSSTVQYGTFHAWGHDAPDAR